MNFNFSENKNIESSEIKKESFVFPKYNDIQENNNFNDANKPIYILCRNETLENDVHPITGIPFERRTVTVENGEKFEGVFPKFDSYYDVQLDKNFYTESDRIQFREANKQLTEECEKNPKLLEKFNEIQKEQILNGDQPDGYTWHHDVDEGKLILVDSEIHGMTGHTGGRLIWGGGSEAR